MDRRLTIRQFLGSSIAMIILGWGGLVLMIFIFDIPPLVWARWGFFVLTILALTGTSLPIIFFIHRRFPGHPPVEAKVLIRQALWVGIYGATLAWLQLGHLVTLYVILGLAGGVVAMEYFIRLRERSHWRPPSLDPHDDTA
jgi:hypothetical protein